MLLAASLSLFVAALWIGWYLVFTAGSGGYGFSMFSYVLAQHYGGFSDPEVLTVVVTRFIVGFGITWFPFATAILFLDYVAGRLNRRFI